jgi:hypothetical protein
MVLGITGLVATIFVSVLLLGLPCCILGVIFSAVAIAKSRARGMAVAGLVTSIVGVAISLVSLCLLAATR